LSYTRKAGSRKLFKSTGIPKAVQTDAAVCIYVQAVLKIAKDLYRDSPTGLGSTVFQSRFNQAAYKNY
jgi:hypothetical protein